MQRFCGNILKRVTTSGVVSCKTFSTTATRDTKLALVGAGGGIGQPLSLLLKHSPYIKSLCLHDMKPMDGISMDLDHIDTSSAVLGYSGENQLAACLDGAEVVVITAGIPRKPGMDRRDLFEVNAKIIMNVTDQIVKNAFNPIICVVSNPVNSLVPVCGEILRLNGVFDIRKLFGVTTLDIVRANNFYARMTGLDARDVNVPVVAGHSGDTIVPLFSLAKPKVDSAIDNSILIDLVRNAGTHVVNAKGGDGSATLSMAYSAFRFITSLLKARLGAEGIVECSYVYAKFHSDIDYFAEPVKLDAEGVAGVFEYNTNITKAEEAMITHAKAKLLDDIKLGVDFVKANYSAPKDVEPQIIGRASPVSVTKAWNRPDIDDAQKNASIPKSKVGDADPKTPLKNEKKSEK